MKRYLVHRASDSTPELDWSVAETLTDFTFPWEDREPSPTEFRALWTEKALHFRFDCVDDDLVLAEGKDDAEKVIGSDRVELFLAPDLDLKPYHGLEMDPRGAVLDYAARYHREFDWDWQCDGLSLQTGIDGDRYHVIGSIPLSTLLSLGVLRPDSREFFAGVYRAEFSHRPDGEIHQGWMAWIDPKTEKPDFHVPASFGVFEMAGF
ncbi:MAG: carbohydrate-binding family 9-like protein [Verrucomicrobiae bacterium]|nr:carbohydrate-binding family 9-like protein [Verrucomicrobiae bacterium]